MEFINKKGYVDRPYKAGLNGVEINVYASSLAEAKQRALEHLKPRKSQRGLLWVVLADTPIDTASL